MQTIQQFISWFSRQKSIGKLAIGCVGFILLCCICAIPVLILSPSSPTTKIEKTDVAVEAVATPTTSEAVALSETPYSVSTNTPLPLVAQPTVNSEIIIETAKIIDATTQQVEEMLGSSTETLPIDISQVEEVPDGGETRTYVIGKYTIWINYNKQGIAKGLQIIDGLLEDGYSLDQWSIILSRIGVGFVGFPDIEAPAARRWTNANGYAIMIAANKIDGNVWTVRIYKIP